MYIAVIAIVAACSKAPSYNISGEITNIDGTIYLTHKFDGKWVNIDSTILVDGKFNFDGSVNAPKQYLLTFKKIKRISIPFIIENSEISITADVKNRPAAKIKGSASQDVMNIYRNEMLPFNKKGRELNSKYREASKNKDSKKMEEIVAEFGKMDKAMIDASLNFIKNHNNSLAAAIVASQQENEDPTEIDKLVALLDESLMTTDELVSMKKKADALRKVEIGQMAPDFTMNDPKGNPITLSSLFGKGYLLVDFWASWCSPCRAENPHVVVAYKEFHDKGFEILGVSYDSKKDKWIEAIEKDQLPWIHVSDLKQWQNLTKELYCISGIPSNVLLDKEGRIVAKNLRGEAVIAKLAELMD